MQNKVCCFGEVLLRLAPTCNWLNENKLPFYIGGAELNVATALANWQVPIKYITTLPHHYLSKQIIQQIHSKNIETDEIFFSGDRLGIYYLPTGLDVKNAEIIYDRAYSSFSQLQPGMFDWDKILSDCSWFHFSAISPALNENVAAVCREAVEAAAAKGLIISVDLNYRSKLWQYGKQPNMVMPELVNYCNVVMGNIWAAEQLLDIPSTIKDSKGKTKKELIITAGESMKQIHQLYPKITDIAFTFRLEEFYFGLLQHGPELAISKEFKLENTIDKVGSGDCFMAGLIYGLQQRHVVNEIINYAAAAAVGKLMEIGDATAQTKSDVLKRLQQQGTEIDS
jgi:2-dehydro-3-deoxygluconokinase